MRPTTRLLTTTMLSGLLLAGCRDAQPIVGSAVGGSGTAASHTPHITLPAGTTLDVTLASQVTSETAGVGDGWTGTTRSPLIVGGRTLIPAGSPVAGARN